MLRPAPRTLFSGYAAAWLYLLFVIAAELCWAALSGHDQAALLHWASTSVDHLEHDPVLTLVASAFFPAESLLAWPVLIALALFGANHVLGNRWTVAVCGAAHVAGRGEHRVPVRRAHRLGRPRRGRMVGQPAGAGPGTHPRPG